MKKILIVGGLPKTPDLVRVFGEYSAGITKLMGNEYKVYTTHLGHLQTVLDTGQFTVVDTHNQLSLQDMDLVVLHAQVRHFGGMGYVLSRFCVYHNIPYFNDFSVYYPGTKVGQAVLFVEAQARIPRTVFALDTELYLQLIAKELTLPFILKDVAGTKGESNYLVHSIDEARRYLAEQPDVTFIAQSYCPNDRDYRVLVTPQQMLAFERRGAADTHLNNTSQGATARLATHDIPSDIVATSRAVAEKIGLTLAGVDVIPHLETGEFYFLEINSQPQLFTGVLLDEKAEFLRAVYQDKLS